MSFLIRYRIIGDRSDKVAVPDGGKAYLRLYPAFWCFAINLELEARRIW